MIREVNMFRLKNEKVLIGLRDKRASNEYSVVRRVGLHFDFRNPDFSGSMFAIGVLCVPSQMRTYFEWP